jgi:hypothetical protein
MVVRIYWHFSLAKKIESDVEPNVISCNMLIVLVTGVFQNNTPRVKRRNTGSYCAGRRE